MLVGVPKEIKDNEYRVGIGPSTVRELTDKGHQVVVEGGAWVGRPGGVLPRCGCAVRVGVDRLLRLLESMEFSVKTTAFDAARATICWSRALGPASEFLDELVS